MSTFNFGYPTDKPCQVCGAKPAEIEPRFGYIVCEKHSKLTPLQIQNMSKLDRTLDIMFKGKTLIDFFNSAGTVVNTDLDNRYIYFPFWIKQISSNTFSIYGFEYLPDDLIRTIEKDRGFVYSPWRTWEQGSPDVEKEVIFQDKYGRKTFEITDKDSYEFYHTNYVRWQYLN